MVFRFNDSRAIAFSGALSWSYRTPFPLEAHTN